MNPNKIIPLIILGIIVVFLAAFIVYPLFLDIKKNSDNLVAQKGLLADLEKKSENIKKFQLTYGVYQANFEKIEQLFVDEEEPVEFIKFLEKEAARAKLNIDLTPVTTKAENEDVWPSANFQVNLAGSFRNFLEFLDKLESSSYLTVLSDFDLNKPTKDTNGDIVVAFKMKIYTK